MRIALVSREVHPLGGGGIGQYVAAAARLLSEIAEVTVFTTDVMTARYHELQAAGHPALSDGVRFVFVPEPTDAEADAWTSKVHLYSARVLAAIKQHYADAPPELIEFCDYLGEGFVTLQAAATLDPFLAGTQIVVRIHTSAEVVDVLNGYARPEFPARAIYELERYCLAHADRVIFQGGDILGTYQRFYGANAIAPGLRIRYPFVGPAAEAEPDFDAAQRPLRMLYLGRLERRKGVLALARAATGMERDDFSLSFIGADTDTAPLGGSVRTNLELAIAEDPRIELLGGLDHGDLAERIRGSDLVILPSRWECWPYAALEPLHLNRPVLGTPVGGLRELVAAGDSGWLATGTDPVALWEALVAVLEDRHGLNAMIRGGRPVAHARALAAPGDYLDAYRALLALPLSRARAAVARAPNGTASTDMGAPARTAPGLVEQPPLVSAIVPYFHAADHVRDTLASLLAQTYERLEIVIVNDGSFEDDDWILAELIARYPVSVVHQMNQGLGAARNFGISQSNGRYVFPLDADNVAEPEFVARCVAVLEAGPEVAYVTAWSRYIDSAGRERPGPDLGYEPLGNWSSLIAEENVAGDAAALLRRRLFDAGFAYSEELTSFEDWALYRRLAQAGHLGRVIPERLLRYRVRDDSLQATIAQPRRRRLAGEMTAHLKESAIRWTS